MVLRNKSKLPGLLYVAQRGQAVLQVSDFALSLVAISGVCSLSAGAKPWIPAGFEGTLKGWV